MTMALSQTLRQLGINQGLEVVGVATAQERQSADEEWLGFCDNHYDGEMAKWIQSFFWQRSLTLFLPRSSS